MEMYQVLWITSRLKLDDFFRKQDLYLNTRTRTQPVAMDVLCSKGAKNPGYLSNYLSENGLNTGQLVLPFFESISEEYYYPS